MKFRGHVIAVDDRGDKLKVKLQACGASDADWRSLNVIEFECAALPSSGRAFYIGRNVSVEVKPL